MLKKHKSNGVIENIHERQIEEFHWMVETQVQREGMDYMEAVVAVCEDYGIDVEECLPLISNSLLSKIQRVCESNNLVKNASSKVDITEELFE